MEITGPKRKNFYFVKEWLDSKSRSSYRSIYCCLKTKENPFSASKHLKTDINSYWKGKKPHYLTNRCVYDNLKTKETGD